MANPNLLDPSVRQAIVREIKSEENKSRRAESLRRFEVYKQRQEKFIVDKLESEFSSKTVREMRKILSINLAPRIINQLASVYQHAPEREWSNVTDDQKEYLLKLYDSAKVDTKMMQANRYFKLNDQVIIQVVPRSGMIQIRCLLPHQVDVIPDANDPEKAYAYIVSVFDKYEYLHDSSNTQDLSNPGRNPYRTSTYSDGTNQTIADKEDYKASLERYEVWTETENFIMDGRGNILSEDTLNPIGMLPFVDVSYEKDFEFWVRTGNGIIDFAIDFGAQLSDIANIIRLQGYAQPIIAADKVPDNMVVGPNHILFLQLDANRPELKPSFEFANPGSDLQSSLDFLEMSLRLFLTSKGIDPKTISGKLDAQSFSSGVERLLSMIEKFEASKADVEIMRWAEMKVYKLLVAWSNYYQGSDVLDESLRFGLQIGPDVEMTVKFSEPQAVQTKTETEDSIIKLLDKGLITKKKALMDLYELNDDQAEQMLAEIEAEKALMVPVMLQPQMEQPVDGEENVQ